MNNPTNPENILAKARDIKKKIDVQKLSASPELLSVLDIFVDLNPDKVINQIKSLKTKYPKLYDEYLNLLQQESEDDIEIKGGNEKKTTAETVKTHKYIEGLGNLKITYTGSLELLDPISGKSSIRETSLMVQQSDGKKEIETGKLVKYLHGIDNSKYTSINIHGDEYVTLYTNGYDVKTGEKISADNAIGQIHFQKTGKKITVSTYGDVRLNFSENKLNYIPNAYVNFTLNRNQDTMNTFKKLLTDIGFMTDENIEIVASSTQLLNSNYDRR